MRQRLFTTVNNEVEREFSGGGGGQKAFTETRHDLYLGLISGCHFLLLDIQWVGGL